ncbi:MAG: YdcF family protein [Luteolibacter sp.]
MTARRLPSSIEAAARILWRYHQLGETIRPSSGILVFGSNDLRVASYAAELYHNHVAPWILFSGARGRMTEHWPETEAAAMARVARNLGVPSDRIHIEDQATNTGENIRFSRDLIARSGLGEGPLLVVQKPYMERRTKAALDIQWHDREFQVTSPRIEFDDYFTEELTPQIVLNAMSGDFRRILDYPAKGFASTQTVPDEVMAAYHELVGGGYGGD